MLETIGGILTVVGAVFVLIGAIGIVRFPDVFTRTHAASVVDTVGAGLVLLGLALHEGVGTASARMLMILAFILLTSPTACHALARSALVAGMRPLVQDGEAEPSDGGS